MDTGTGTGTSRRDSLFNLTRRVSSTFSASVLRPSTPGNIGHGNDADDVEEPDNNNTRAGTRRRSSLFNLSRKGSSTFSASALRPSTPGSFGPGDGDGAGAEVRAGATEDNDTSSQPAPRNRRRHSLSFGRLSTIFVPRGRKDAQEDVVMDTSIHAA